MVWAGHVLGRPWAKLSMVWAGQANGCAGSGLGWAWTVLSMVSSVLGLCWPWSGLALHVARQDHGLPSQKLAQPMASQTHCQTSPCNPISSTEHVKNQQMDGTAHG